MQKVKAGVEAGAGVLVINGVEYIPKNTELKIVDNYVIVRTHSAGAHAGELIAQKGKQVSLKNSRRLYYWKGAATLSQLATEGVKFPLECKFPCELPLIILTEAIEIISCTQIAVDSIKGVPVWEI